MKPPIIQITDCSGGMTLSDKMGRKNQFHIGKGLDFFSKLGYLSVGIAFKNMTYNASEEIPTEFNCMLYAQTDGKKYFGGTDGKIYREATDGTLELAHSVGSAILSMEEYKGCLYYTTQSALGRYDFTSWTDDFQTLNSANYHPLVVQAGELYIGNKQYVAAYDGATFQSNALDLAEGWEIRSLQPFGLTNIVIGANYGKRQGNLFIWDRISESWNDTIRIPENEIKAMIFSAGYLWIFGGTSCNIYVCREDSRLAEKIWSFSRENPLQDFEVYPNAVVVRKGVVFFGLSDVDNYSKDENPSAIYSFPLNPRNFTLNIPFKGEGYKERYKSLGILGSTNTLYFSYRNYISEGGEYNNLKREKNINESDPYNQIAEFESFKFQAPFNKKIRTESFGIICDSLPSDCSISFYYKTEQDSDWQFLFTLSSQGITEKKIERVLTSRELKLKLTLQGSSSTPKRPFVNSIYVTGATITKP